MSPSLVRSVVCLAQAALPLVTAAGPVFLEDDRPAWVTQDGSLTVGDPLPRIVCDDGRSARVYAEGLSGPDGLALSPIDGALHVAEESAGRVLRIDSDGTTSVVVDGVLSPEGIAFDPNGNLYVTEDVEDGRVLQVAPDGTVTTIATGRDAPEGIVYASDGNLYITESNVQFVSPLQYRTKVTRVGLDGAIEEILSLALFWSYAGITEGPDRFLYVTNEAASVGTNASVIRIDPTSGARVGTVRGLTFPEGLSFVPTGGLPLYVAQEDVGGGSGATARIEPGLAVVTHCTGFSTLEDVLTTASGSIFVSEDGTGLVVELAPADGPAPTGAAVH